MAIEVGASGGGLPQLAPDLTFPQRLSDADAYEEDTIDTTTGGLVTLINAPVKSAILLIQLTGIPLELITLTGTRDGVVIWNPPSFTPTSTALLLVGSNASTGSSADSFQCNSSFTLEMTSTTGTAVIVRKLVRPIE